MASSVRLGDAQIALFAGLLLLLGSCFFLEARFSVSFPNTTSVGRR
jgi:hypothetical protein